MPIPMNFSVVFQFEGHLHKSVSVVVHFAQGNIKMAIPPRFRAFVGGLLILGACVLGCTGYEIGVSSDEDGLRSFKESSDSFDESESD